MDDEVEISLEDLSRTYQQYFGAAVAPNAETDSKAAPAELLEPDATVDSRIAISPEAIIEAILFVGHPKNRWFAAQELTANMRGVKAADIPAIVDHLNERYEDNALVYRIESSDDGYRMVLDPAMRDIVSVFASKVQTLKLNQQAIDCLSLIAYNPGCSLEAIESLWNRPAGSVVRMLLRRNLIELEREGSGKAAVLRYYPAERFFELVGIESLEDLPTVEA